MSRHVATDFVGDIMLLHEKFGNKPALVAAMPQEVRDAYLAFRIAFLGEELEETRTAHHPADVVDGLIDLCVVAIGTLHAFGVNTAEAWRRVQAANMAKHVGVNPKRPNKFGLPDLIKPDGWIPPDHTGNTGIITVPIQLEVPL